MSYTNAAKRIYDLIAATLTSAIPDLTVKSVYQFPADDESAAHIGRFGRSALVRCQDYDASDRADNERLYTFELRAFVKDSDIEQHAVTDLVDQIRYHLHTVRHTTVWTHLKVNSVEFAEQAVENVKQGRMFLEVLYND